MKLTRHRNFLKNYQKRILPSKKLDTKFEARLKIFLADPQSDILKDHKLTGDKKDFRAFSVTGDIRCVYKIIADTIELYDVGTHNQVY